MIPGLAFFYGGMTRVKSVLNMLMMVMGALFIVGILWVAFGYSVAFGDNLGDAGLLGSPTQFAWLEGLMTDDPEATLPVMAFVAFQAMFACITVGLIAGAVADRTKFSAWMVFSAIWATLVYFPVAHWVWASGGWIFELGVIDFAGGTAVHINAGAAALALVFIIGKRVGWPKTAMRPHNLTLVMIGAGLLWFGWFGFNAGSALAANNAASVVFVNTFVATCAAGLAWLLVEKLRDGHATSLGAASGIVAGLVAITPSCSAVSPVGAIIIGIVGRRAVRPGRRHEVQARLRRLARRGRRPPGRRSRRHPAHRVPGHVGRPGRGGRSLLRRRSRSARQAGDRRLRGAVLLADRRRDHRRSSSR